MRTSTDVYVALLIGCLFGFGFGYIVRFLQDILATLTETKEEVDDLTMIARKNHPEDFGAARMSFLRDVALAVVVLLVAWAALSSQHASDKSNENSKQVIQTQDFVVRIATCNQQFLAATLRALNQRQESVQKRADANLDLQKEQAAFFSLLLGQPPKSEAVRRHAAEKYLDALTHFVEQSNRTEQQNNAFPYPTNEELNNCINNR
jgi:hypothetical protein